MQHDDRPCIAIIGRRNVFVLEHQVSFTGVPEHGVLEDPGIAGEIVRAERCVRILPIHRDPDGSELADALHQCRFR